ncbi:MAG: hypothetical protein JXR19_06795 [Bacteroidia bacterium]
MRIICFILFLGVLTGKGIGQVYVLQDHRPQIDEVDYYDSLQELSDSVYHRFINEDIAGIEMITPDTNALRYSLDSTYQEYATSDLLTRRAQIKIRLNKSLRQQYKSYRKNKVILGQFKKDKLTYKFGITPQGNEFCYVTIRCSRKKRKLNITFLALKIQGHWFLGDELRSSLE